MLPAQYYLLAKLPLTNSGKLDEANLPKIDSSKLITSKPPETQLQFALANYWQTILEKTSIGIEDDFFLLGGQSLQVIHLLSIIQQNHAIKIPLKTFYRSPTIIGLEKFIQHHTKELTCQAI
jgi:acyl carrier protein